MKSLSRLSPLVRRLLAAFGTRTFKVRFDSVLQAFVPLPMTQSEVRAFPTSQFQLAHFQINNEVQLFRDSQDKKVDSKFKAGDQHWAAFNFQPIPYPKTAQQQFEGILRQQKGYFDNSELISFAIGRFGVCLFAPPRFGKTTGLRMLQAFYGIPFKNGQIDESKMRFFAESFQKMNVCKKQTKQEWQEYKSKYMHKYVVLRIQFPEVNEGTTKMEVIEDLIKKIVSKLNQVGATNNQEIHQAKSLTQLALDIAFVFESNTITQKNRPILMFDQTERVFQRIKELYRLSKDEAQKQQLMSICNSFMEFLHKLTKQKGIRCILAGSQPFYQKQYTNTMLNNFSYFREQQFDKYFLPTTQQFERKIKQDFPLSATREQLKLISRLSNGCRLHETGYTNLHSAFKLLSKTDPSYYYDKQMGGVSPHFEMLMRNYQHGVRSQLQTLIDDGKRPLFKQEQDFRSNLRYSSPEIQKELLVEGIIGIKHQQHQQRYQQSVRPLNLAKVHALLRFLGTNIPFAVGCALIEQLNMSEIVRASLGLCQLETVCNDVAKWLKALRTYVSIESRADMVAALGTGFSVLADQLLHQTRASARGKSTAGQIDKLFYSFNKEQAAVTQYMFSKDGSKTLLEELADKAIKQIASGLLQAGEDSELKEIKIGPKCRISVFREEKQVKRVFVVGVAMNSIADCCWSVLELELRRQAQSLWARQVGRTSGKTVGISAFKLS